MGLAYLILFACISVVLGANVGKYAIHGASGLICIYTPGSPIDQPKNSLYDDPCKGFPTTKGQSLAGLDFLGI